MFFLHINISLYIVKKSFLEEVCYVGLFFYELFTGQMSFCHYFSMPTFKFYRRLRHQEKALAQQIRGKSNRVYNFSLIVKVLNKKKTPREFPHNSFFNI